MRTEANGIAVRREVAAAGLGRRPDRQLAPLREAAHPALSLPRRRRGAYRRTRAPARCATSRSPIPGDRRAVGRDDEFLFGPDLLAAPVLEPGATERALYLPRGRWVDLWRSARLPRAPRVAGPGAREAAPWWQGGHPARSAGRVAPSGSRRDAAGVCCRPMSTRSATTRTVRPPRSTSAATSWLCWPSLGARARRASTRTSESARASGDGAGRCGSRASAGAPTASRPRSGRSPSASTHAR